MSSIRKFITYDLLNDFILYRDIEEKFQCSENDGRFRNIIKSIESEEMPVGVDVHIKNNKRGQKSDSSYFSLVILLSEDTNLSKHGKFMVNVSFPNEQLVPLSKVEVSCYTFNVPKKIKHDRILINVSFVKNSEILTKSDFEFFKQFSNENYFDSLVVPTMKTSTSLSSDEDIIIPAAPKKINLDLSVSTNMSCGESFYGEISSSNQFPIGTGKPKKTSKELEIEQRIEHEDFMRVRRIADETIYKEYKKQLSCKHVLTTNETVELLKVSLSKDADIYANLIILAAKVKGNLFLHNFYFLISYSFILYSTIITPSRLK